MTKTVGTSAGSDRAARIRNALTDQLLEKKMITSPVLERAFRAVPREAFVPEGTPLEVAYNADDSVTTKTDEHGVIISSISAPFIQARMIEQAALRPGMSVLEIGSGGYNAALLTEVVGADGRVVSVDIDAEVTGRARAALEVTGYGGRVTVMNADAEHPIPGLGTVDALLVTVGAWDIPPAWIEQLTEDGRLVVPLRMNGITRSIAFRRTGDHLESTSAEVCGFVAMQGTGAHDERVFLLPDAQGRNVKLRFDDGAPKDMSLLDGVLTTGRSEVWSGVTIDHGVSFADLHLWFAGHLPGFCKLATDPGTEIAEEGIGKGWFPFGVVRGDSFAYLAVRCTHDGGGIEFGARACGPSGTTAATAMVEQIQAWDNEARSGSPTFAYWPTGSDHAQIPGGAAVLEKTHGLVTITWPR